MLRLATVFWILLVSTAAGGMYAVKYRVQGLERTLVKTEKATIAEQREIRVLEAEWTYLNRPQTLAQMNARFLSLAPITTKALRTSVADVPMRPAPGEAIPQGKLVTVAATSALASPQPRVMPAVLREGPTERAVSARPAARSIPGRDPEARWASDGRSLEAIATTTPQSHSPRRSRSLDDLIAHIVVSR
jgi:hypothetical protein